MSCRPLGMCAQQDPDPKRFEKEIAAFEAEDRASPPKAGSVLFVGSSSIRCWDLGTRFPGLNAIKRGFRGSYISDNIYYADRVIFPYKPRLIVFYAGDADVAAQKKADRIFADCKTLIEMIHTKLPDTRIVVIGTKPSAAYWKHIDTIRKANALVQDYVMDDPLVAYAAVDRTLIGPDGQPRPDFCVENGLNLTGRGYTAWTETVRPLIEKPWTRKK